jgi:hypothetical protein
MQTAADLVLPVAASFFSLYAHVFPDSSGSPVLNAAVSAAAPRPPVSTTI